jgi:hypothetical protein
MKKQTRNDLLLVLAILLCAGAFLLYTNLTRSDGAYAVAYVSGKEVARYPLGKPAETVLRTAASGTNTLVIENGEAWVSEANCPDKVCMGMGKISKNGEFIACLPNQVIIVVEGGEESPVDGRT